MKAGPGRVEVVADRAGERLDAAVARLAGISRSVAAKLIDAGAVRIGEATPSRSQRVEEGARIVVDLPDDPLPPQPEDIPIPVVYVDRWLVVISKPAGLVVHPAPGHPSGTVVNALLARAGATPLPGDATRPGIVHRLDAGTSGLMIVATDEEAFTELQRMMAAREVSRTYHALVEGAPPPSGEIDAPVGRSPKQRKKMAVVAGGREARTSYRRLEALPDTGLLEVRPLTGRTHQIRVHFAAAGYPIVGDAVYGKNRKLGRALGLERPFLHAAKLAFAHPITHEAIDLSEPLPEDLRSALSLARSRPPR